MQKWGAMFHRHFGQHRMLGGAAVLALTQFGASLAGLIRDNVLASTFSARGEVGVVDTYIASFRPSDFLLQTFILSAVGTVLVPMIAGYREKSDKRGMEDLLAGAIGAGALLFGALALILAVLFPRIAPAFVNFQGDQLLLYIRFGRIALLTNFLFVFGNVYGQYLMTTQRYWIYGITPILYTVGTIVGTIVLTPLHGAYGPILGTLAGTIVFVILRIWAVHASGVALRIRLWHPDIGQMGLLMIPRMVALSALQLQLLFFDKFASGLDAGSVMLNAYARNFQSVIVGVAGIAVAQSAFALLSQAAVRGERDRFMIYVRKGVGLLLILTIPGAIALALLAPLAARLVHITEYLPTFRVILLAYVISIPFESINHLLLRSYYATKHTLVPAFGMVVSVAVAVSIAWKYLPVLGVQALGIGYTAGAVSMTVLLAILLPLRLMRMQLRVESNVS
jgi:putative peptidoglycan lipid II flippase